MESEKMGTEVVTGERKSPYINETKLYHIPVLNKRCELLADKKGKHGNTPDMQEPQKRKGKVNLITRNFSRKNTEKFKYFLEKKS